MPIVREFGEELQRAVGALKQREVAERTGISQPYVNQMMNGKIPTLDTLMKLLGGLRIEDRRRARLFRLAGHQDPYEAMPRTISDDAADVVQRWESLSADNREIIRRLLEHPERLEAIRMLIDGRVRYAPA